MYFSLVMKLAVSFTNLPKMQTLTLLKSHKTEGYSSENLPLERSSCQREFANVDMQSQALEAPDMMADDVLPVVRIEILIA